MYQVQDLKLLVTMPNSQHKSLDSLSLYNAFRTHSSTDRRLAKALEVLEGAVRLYTPANLAVAFNGGKDATVVVHLARAVVAKYAYENDTSAKLHCLYLLGGDDEFSSVETFVRTQVNDFNLDLVEVCAGFKEGIKLFTKDKSLCTFVMGTRRDDPHGKNMEHFEPSSPGWPRFMRVNPILTWDYHDVWKFLRKFSLPYCEMYDRGYTSIGSVPTTIPNPALCCTDNDGQVSYKPAWMLENASLERAGRISKSK